MKKSMYDGSTPRGLHLRAVVTPTGDVVAKNYDSRKLIEESKEGEPGDVGLCVRLDGRTDALTPAQRTSLEHQAQVMADALRRRAGIEVEAEWQAGMVVKATNNHTEVIGIVVSEDETTLRLKSFTCKGKGLKRVSLPKSTFVVEEESGRNGLDDLFLVVLACEEDRGKQDGDWMIQILKNVYTSLQATTLREWAKSVVERYIYVPDIIKEAISKFDDRCMLEGMLEWHPNDVWRVCVQERLKALTT